MRLPQIMIAPNGAHKTKVDHPNIPLSLDEIVAEAKASFANGAGALHLHLRDKDDGHILDAGLYREALAELSVQVPEMMLQITTEAVGIYTAKQQRDVVLQTGADYISASIREMHADTDMAVVRGFFEECAARGISIQHILYDVEDFELLQRTLSGDAFANPDLQILYVLGRYAGEKGSQVNDLDPFVAFQNQVSISPDWAICAFGKAETQCLGAAHKLGGKMRVGFENSFWNYDGTIASTNAARVLDVKKYAQI